MSVPLLFWDVDTQIDFISPQGALYVPDAETLAPNLERLTRAAKRLAIPVIADADDHEWTDIEISSDPDFRITFPPHCMRGTPGVERIPETRQDWTLVAGHQPLDRDEIRAGLDQPHPRILIHKKTLDIFSNPNTEVILEMLAPQNVVVYGVALDFCSRKVIEGLLARDQTGIVVVSDATKPIYPENIPSLTARWEERGVIMRTTDEILSELESSGLPAPRPQTVLERQDSWL